jgi:hypothetical protein
MGSIMLIGTVLMALWTPSYEVELDQGSDPIFLTGIDVGFLGSEDVVEVSVLPSETCSSSNSSTCSIVVNVGNESLAFPEDEMWNSLSSTRTSDGPLNISVTGSGDYEIKISVKRQLPLEAIPAILGLFLLVWGEWRRRQ